MTPSEAIKKMLADPDSDNDEVNARIWCLIKNKKILGKTNDKWMYHGGVRNFYCGDDEGWANSIMPKYTTSLDAAMSIGVEELEGWLMYIREWDIGTIAEIRLGSIDYGSKQQRLTMPRAICHARIQALEYKREPS